MDNRNVAAIRESLARHIPQLNEPASTREAARQGISDGVWRASRIIDIPTSRRWQDYGNDVKEDNDEEEEERRKAKRAAKKAKKAERHKQKKKKEKEKKARDKGKGKEVDGESKDSGKGKQPTKARPSRSVKTTGNNNNNSSLDPDDPHYRPPALPSWKSHTNTTNNRMSRINFAEYFLDRGEDQAAADWRRQQRGEWEGASSTGSGSSNASRSGSPRKERVRASAGASFLSSQTESTIAPESDAEREAKLEAKYAAYMERREEQKKRNSADLHKLLFLEVSNHNQEDQDQDQDLSWLQRTTPSKLIEIHTDQLLRDLLDRPRPAPVPFSHIVLLAEPFGVTEDALKAFLKKRARYKK